MVGSATVCLYHKFLQPKQSLRMKTDLEKHNGQLWCQNLSLVAFSLRNSKHLGTQLFSLWVNAQKVEHLRCGWAVPPSIPLHRQHLVVMENDKKINREA